SRDHPHLPSFPTRRSSDLGFAYAGFLLVLRRGNADVRRPAGPLFDATLMGAVASLLIGLPLGEVDLVPTWPAHGYLLALALSSRSEEHTSELQSRSELVCR